MNLLMYIRLLDGSEHPITEEMLTNYSNIDYTKVNQEQIVTIQTIPRKNTKKP